jgi:predicted DNA-binding protein
MVRTQVYLTKEEREALRWIAAVTQRTESEIMREAVDQLIKDSHEGNLLNLLRQVRELWKKRTDLADFRALRRERDRASHK